MYNTMLQIHSGKQQRLVTFIGLSQSELAFYNLESLSLSTNNSLFPHFAVAAVHEQRTVVFVWFWFGSLGFYQQLMSNI